MPAKPRTTRLTGYVLVASVGFPVGCRLPAGEQRPLGELRRLRLPGRPARCGPAGRTTMLGLLLMGGHIECPSCDRGCGTWNVALPGDDI